MMPSNNNKGKASAFQFNVVIVTARQRDREMNDLYSRLLPPLVRPEVIRQLQFLLLVLVVVDAIIFIF